MARSISELSSFQRLKRALDERKAWEAAHPELAAAWTDALREDAEREARKEYEAAVARANTAIPDRLRMLGVPVPVVQALRNPIETPSLKAARRYFEPDKSRWLALLGKASTGKTLAAAWVLGTWLAKHSAWSQPTTTGARSEVGLFVNATELSGMSDYREEDKAYLQRLMRCGLLVVDDLGAERQGEMELGLVQKLLMHRHANAMRTVLTSNLDAKGFAERYGERVSERMREVCWVVNAGQQGLRGKHKEGA